MVHNWAKGSKDSGHSVHTIRVKCTIYENLRAPKCFEHRKRRDPLVVATRLRRRGGGIFSSSENRGGKNEGRVMRSRCILRPALVLHIKPSWMQFQTCFSLSLSFLSPLRLIRVHGTGHEGSEDLSLSLFFFYFHARISWWIMILTELFEVSGRKISCHRVRDRIEMKNLYEVILFFFYFSFSFG